MTWFQWLLQILGFFVALIGLILYGLAYMVIQAGKALIVVLFAVLVLWSIWFTVSGNWAKW